MQNDDSGGTLPSALLQHIDIFCCPACGGSLKVPGDRSGMECSECHRYFRGENGIPLLFWPNEWEESKEDVTDAVRSFYEENPFPSYEDLDSSESLRQKAEKGVFARLLDDQIPYGARVLEVGCGTGQLSNFLGMRWGRSVLATDICLNSLRMGHDFKEKNQIANVCFVQMNLFRPVFRQDTFDLVICNGVLHHTSDPFSGFQSISGLATKGGYLIVGLYNTYGRIPQDIRRLIFRLTGDRLKFLDSRLRDSSIGDARKHIWFLDQYKNPCESKQTIGEVLSWFDRSGVEFVNSIPKCRALEPFSPREKLFEARSRGTGFDHFLVQLGMLLSGGREGGFFTMIGRRDS